MDWLLRTLMNTPLRPLRLLLPLLLTLLLPAAGQTPPGASGSIAGRVTNAAGDTFLERVRVTVEGTSLETFTDAGGAYRLDGVPAGAVRVRLCSTGLAVQSAPGSVVAGHSA
ncbi:MAG: hypothetical protein RLZZ447_2180, partial [Verrucomicrobiota bacterium]